MLQENVSKLIQSIFTYPCQGLGWTLLVHHHLCTNCTRFNEVPCVCECVCVCVCSCVLRVCAYMYMGECVLHQMSACKVVCCFICKYTYVHSSTCTVDTQHTVYQHYHTHTQTYTHTTHTHIHTHTYTHTHTHTQTGHMWPPELHKVFLLNSFQEFL